MDEQKETLSNPWLAPPKPAGLLSREALEDRILNLLSSQNMAVIATVAPDGSPSATPVRYSSLGMEIMCTSWNASPKSRNLRLDPRVSVGIFAPLVGPASSRGAQFFGAARTLERDHSEADRYWSVFRWQADQVENRRPLSGPPIDPLTVITVDRVLYTEHWLRRSGFNPRQVWRRNG